MHLRLLSKISTLFLLVLFVSNAQAQSGISLYHLTNHTYQGNNFNPAFFPDGKFFLGIPAISGIYVDVNSPVSYKDLAGVDEQGGKFWDFGNFVDLAENRNYIQAEAEVSTLYMGFRPKSTFGWSVFVRERITANGFYGDDEVQFAWNGNAGLVGRDVDISSTLVDARYYREYGLGLWTSIPNKAINMGVRVKYLNGMISAITDSKFDGTVEVGSDYAHRFDLSSATVNTSGLNILDSDELSSHLISNGNIGFGVDLGTHWKINEYVSAAVSVNDLGFIRWKVDPENYLLLDTAFVFEGVSDLKELDNFGEALDSLLEKFVDTTTTRSYTTGLNTRAFGSMFLQLTPNDLFSATMAGYWVQDQVKMQYALGYTRTVGDILSASVNVIRTPQQGFDVGVGLAAKFGPVQMYMASDKLARIWNVPETQSVNLRFGINFVFGKPKTVKDDKKDLQHPSPWNKGERVEESDGIYWIIKRRKEPEPYPYPKGVKKGR